MSTFGIPAREVTSNILSVSIRQITDLLATNIATICLHKSFNFAFTIVTTYHPQLQLEMQNF